MMRGMKAWLFLLSLSTGATLWLASGLFMKTLSYYHHHQPIPIHPLEWKIVPKDSDHYLLALNFTYTYNKALYKGHYLFEKETYPTTEFAKDAIPTLTQEPLVGWLSPSPSSPHVVLERSFPYTLFIRTAAALCISLYFFSLRQYIYSQSERA